jgi:hypothetical protein
MLRMDISLVLRVRSRGVKLETPGLSGVKVDRALLCFGRFLKWSLMDLVGKSDVITSSGISLENHQLRSTQMRWGSYSFKGRKTNSLSSISLWGMDRCTSSTRSEPYRRMSKSILRGPFSRILTLPKLFSMSFNRESNSIGLKVVSIYWYLASKCFVQE